MKLSKDDYKEVRKLEKRLDRCKERLLYWRIDDVDFVNNSERPPGIPVKNSCNLPFCPYCKKRLVFMQKKSMYERFDDLGYVYHFTFSPEFEFWSFSQDVKKAVGIVRNRLITAIRSFVEKRGGRILGFYGWHYIGDKNEGFQRRLHAHILFSTNIDLNVYSVYEKKTFKKKKGNKNRELYSYAEQEIIEDFKERLRRTKYFDWSARMDFIKKSSSTFKYWKNKKGPRAEKRREEIVNFVYFYNVDVKKERDFVYQKNHGPMIWGKTGLTDLMEAVGYLCKYMVISKKKVLQDKRMEFLTYYAYHKSSFIVPFGEIRRGLKPKREFPPVKPFINKITSREMICLSEWVLNVDFHIFPVKIWEYYDNVALSFVDLAWLDMLKKASGE